MGRSTLLSLALSLVGSLAGCSDGTTHGTTAGSGGADAGGSGSGGLGFGGGRSVPQTCGDAEASDSSLGCQFLPTITSNAALYPGFTFDVVVANPTESVAELTVRRGGTTLGTGKLAPGTTAPIALPWIDELKGVEMSATFDDLTSAFVPSGAYWLDASVPVSVVQFNPLEYQLPNAPPNCPHTSTFGGCFSFTNDASLLLPTASFGREHYVLAYPTLHIGHENTVFMTTGWLNRPGFVAITASADDTQVTFETTAHVRPAPSVPALAPGDSATFDLQAGDVLMLASGVVPDGPTPTPDAPCVVDPQGNVDVHLCPTPRDYDLTGSHVVATKPVGVIAGHDCSFVPYDVLACDHLEDSLFPVETLGREVVLTAPRAAESDARAPRVVRILSASPDNHLTLEPPVHADVVLQAGEWLELGPLADDFQVRGTGKLLVGEYFVGETHESGDGGDPSFAVAIPIEQYRDGYAFLTPTTYPQSFVNVVASEGAEVILDGVPITSFDPIGPSGLGVARVAIGGGSHQIHGSSPLGILVYGYGPYTSYAFPGGTRLAPVILPP